MKKSSRDFFQGRYGVDEFSGFLQILLFLFLIGGLITKHPAFPFPVFALSGILLYRGLSKNTEERKKENDYYLYVTAPLRRKFRLFKEKRKHRKTHKVMECPECHALLRVPKGKGKVKVRCTKCGNLHEWRT